MKTEDSALTSDSERETNKLFLIILILIVFSSNIFAINFKTIKIRDILIKINNKKTNISDYYHLLSINKGEFVNLKKIRESIDNLFRTQNFTDIQAKLKLINESNAILIFSLKSKIYLKKIIINTNAIIKKRELLNYIRVKKHSFFTINDVKLSVHDIRNFYLNKGYFNPEIEYKIIKLKKNKAKIFYNIKVKPLKKICSINIITDNKNFDKKIRSFFKFKYYVPEKINNAIKNLKNYLYNKNFYFPEIKKKMLFVDKDKSLVYLNINIKTGYRYEFVFKGIKDKTKLVKNIWSKKVFEKWAEKESISRLLEYLRNRGYLNAKIEVKSEIQGKKKKIIFVINKSTKYKLGEIHFEGNKTYSTKFLKKLIKTDDLIFNKYLFFKLSPLLVDNEILKIFYKYNGFNDIKIKPELTFRRNKVNINFNISEGKRHTIKKIIFSGNKFFKNDKLLSIINSKVNNVFIRKIINNDAELIRNLYLKNGFKDIIVNYEISPNLNKEITFFIQEGKRYKLNKLIVIGGNKEQRTLIRKLFPIKQDEYIDYTKIKEFQQKIETSGIFLSILFDEIKSNNENVNYLIKINSDNTKVYGFGIGWEERKGGRITLEYQENNIFKTYSTFSALIQAGLNERRGVISYNTPFVFNKDLSSELRMWQEDEYYSSYKFLRFGLSSSLIKKLTSTSYLTSSIKWYKTTLTELLIPESGIDKLNKPFYTTTFSMSYINDKRDDPFNPKSGDFFSADVKIGLPIFEKDYKFFKFYWSYQKNIELFKNGIISFSLRNGFASGDMSITERFFAGGSHSFRGTRTDRLGPINVETNEPMGGNAIFIFNFEFNFPLYIIPIDNLSYSLFADIGNVYWKASDFDLMRVERALGFGIRYKSPLGPLRIDFALNLRKRSENRFLIQIGIGNVF